MSKFNATINLILSGLPALLCLFAFLLATSPPALLLLCGAGYAGGLVQLFRAKRSLFRQGIWISFGPARMSSANRRHYLTGYTCIGLAGVCNVWLLLPVAFASCS